LRRSPDWIASASSSSFQHGAHALAILEDAAGPVGNRGRRIQAQDQLRAHRDVRHRLAQVVRKRPREAFAHRIGGHDEGAHALAHRHVDGQVQGAPLGAGQGDFVRVQHVEQHAAEHLELGQDAFGVVIGQGGALDPVLGADARDVDPVAAEISRGQDRAHAFVQHRHRVHQYRRAQLDGARQRVAQLVFP
jgi:hypothetical protein